jgi:uncharacterized protein YndB with AHSA1/START domain
MDVYGTYEEIDGRPALKFERRYPHPVEKVWRAVTDPGELAHWFPAEMTFEPRVGATVSFVFPDGGMPSSEGEVKQLEAPRLFAFSWDDELLTFELEPAGGEACLLRFTHILSERGQAAGVAGGWHLCFEELDKHLAGLPAKAPGTTHTDRSRELHALYEQRGLPSGAPMPTDS